MQRKKEVEQNKVVPEKDVIQQAIDQARALITVQNDDVAKGESMDAFDNRMQGVVGSYRSKTMFAYLSVLIAMYAIYEAGKNNEEIPSPALYLAMGMMLVLGNAFINSKLGLNSLFNNRERDLIKLQGMRGEIKYSIKSLEDLEKNAGVVSKHKIGNCFELCSLVANELVKEESLKGKHITQLFLKSSSNARHDHTILVISDRQIKTSDVKGKYVSDLKNVVIVDPWYGTVPPKIDTAKQPLLAYPIESVDFSFDVKENKPSLKRK